MSQFLSRAHTGLKQTEGIVHIYTLLFLSFSTMEVKGVGRRSSSRRRVNNFSLLNAPISYYTLQNTMWNWYSSEVVRAALAFTCVRAFIV